VSTPVPDLRGRRRATGTYFWAVVRSALFELQGGPCLGQADQVFDVLVLLPGTNPPLSDAEFEALADQLTDDVEACAGGAAGSLSDAAVSREGIYEDHP
jgi:hypothetical protein